LPEKCRIFTSVTILTRSFFIWLINPEGQNLSKKSLLFPTRRQAFCIGNSKDVEKGSTLLRQIKKQQFQVKIITELKMMFDILDHEMGLDSNRLDKNAEHGNLPLHLLVFWAGKKC
jgi:hypothetical protein